MIFLISPLQAVLAFPAQAGQHQVLCLSEAHSAKFQVPSIHLHPPKKRLSVEVHTPYSAASSFWCFALKETNQLLCGKVRQSN